MGKRVRKLNKTKRKRQKSIESKTESELQIEGSFIVEKIIDWGLHDNGLKMFLIKWQNYDSNHNSWEFDFQLHECEELLQEFHSTINGRHPPKYSWQEFHKFIDYLKLIIHDNYNDIAVLRLLSTKKRSLAELKSEKTINEIKSRIRFECNRLLDKKFKSRTNAERIESRILSANVSKALNIWKNFGSITEFFEFVDKRKEVIKDLKRWERKQNEIIIKENEGKPISIVNEIDLEKPSLTKYITKYILDVKLNLNLEIEDEKPLFSCECDDCYESRDECCSAVIGFPMVYNSKGLLSFSRYSTIIFECNSECKCGPNCSNRSIQMGRQSKLQIFRTEDVRGWGVRALEPIARGAFVSQYTGEVISLTEAEKRPTTYLFDLSAHLDSTDVGFTYVVDASNYGNITRFVNHSCDPNCRILFAWIKNYNKLLPVIALFTIKPIRQFEELTYDYSMEILDVFDQNYNSSSESDCESNQFSEDLSFCDRVLNKENKENNRNENESEDNKVLKHERQRKVSFEEIECKCGAKNCRKKLYS
jgi:histone-lysine N-methyltransferase SUV39H